MPDLVIRNATIVTMAPAGVVTGDISVVAGQITAVGTVSDPGGRGRVTGADADVTGADADVIDAGGEVIDAGGAVVIPGLVQAHVHLCQTLFRGIRDDVDVIEWLRGWIWPLEQRHDRDSMLASCRLGIAELLLGGTTTVLSMESVRHTDASFEAAAGLGIRAFIGKALMDNRETGTEMYGEDTAAALADVRRLIDRWDRTEGGRLRVALSPRGPRNATPDLWRVVVRLAEEHDLVLHTHVDENRAQAERVRAYGGRDMVALHGWGALTHRLVMAHCVWPDEEELELLAGSGAHVCHCPSANLKLASGIAPVPLFLERGINVALGADGAACNNRLDAFEEMRLAALIQKPLHGPMAMPAEQVLHLATRGGAAALGMGDRIGSIEVGKAADLVVLRPAGVRAAPGGASPSMRDIASDLVYTRSPADVRTVIVDGRVVVADGVLLTGSESDIAAQAQVQRRRIVERMSHDL